MGTSFYVTNSGSKFVTPDGTAEPGQIYFDSGMRWSAFNCADGASWSDWSRARARQPGIRFAVGGRVKNVGGLAGVDYLMGIAIQNHVACILNIEDEFKTTPPAAFAARIKSIRAAHPTYTRETVLNTVGWLYNDADYVPLVSAVTGILLQCYPTDNGWAPAQIPQKTQDCIAHAVAKGWPLRKIGVTFEATDHAPDPSWYAFWGDKPRSYFTGNWITARGAWSQWAV